MAYYVGVDGGGSTLRVVIVDDALTVIAETQRETVNPSSVGRLLAHERLISAIQEILHHAHLEPNAIRAVGVGIAGASVEHSEGWLREVFTPLFPSSTLALSSDVEIALVGANGARTGILLLAGTGSCAYGVGSKGNGLMVGGWGYLLGDRGGGFAIGISVLKTLADMTDNGSQNAHYWQLLEALGFEEPRHLITWVYGRPNLPVREIAHFAPRVMALADNGNILAQQALRVEAMWLKQLTQNLKRRLRLPKDAPIQFAGGLLEHSNSYSLMVSKILGLAEFPKARYSPVIGGALLGKIRADAPIEPLLEFNPAPMTLDDDEYEEDDDE